MTRIYNMFYLSKRHNSNVSQNDSGLKIDVPTEKVEGVSFKYDLKSETGWAVSKMSLRNKVVDTTISNNTSVFLNFSNFITKLKSKISFSNLKLLDMNDQHSWSFRIRQLVATGLNNIQLAIRAAKGSDYNDNVIQGMYLFFKGLKSNFVEYSNSLRCKATLDMLMDKARKSGVELFSCINNNVLTIWTYGLQNIHMRKMLSRNSKLEMQIIYNNVNRVGSNAFAQVTIGSQTYDIKKVSTAKASFNINRLLILMDKGWNAFNMNFNFKVNSLNIEFADFQETLVNTAFVSGNDHYTIGKTFKERIFTDVALILNFPERILLLIMSNYHETICLNPYLFNLWFRMFVQSTMDTTGRKFEHCNFTIAVAMDYSPMSNDQLDNLPWTASVYNNDDWSILPHSDIVTGLLLHNIDNDFEISNFDCFQFYPSMSDIDTWRTSKCRGLWAYDSEILRTMGISNDTTLETPTEWGDLFYLMYTHFGLFTPKVLTPLVLEHNILFQEKQFIGTYTINELNWADLVFNDSWRLIADINTLPFETKIIDGSYIPTVFKIVRPEKFI